MPYAPQVRVSAGPLGRLVGFDSTHSGSSADLAADAQALRYMEGLHLAILDKNERAAFLRLQAAGLAQAEYRGASGYLGIGRLRLVPST